MSKISVISKPLSPAEKYVAASWGIKTSQLNDFDVLEYLAALHADIQNLESEKRTLKHYNRG